LAERGLGSTSPNPPVGAVVVREGRTLGEGFHHVRGAPHAEVEALRLAGEGARGATLYVSLEPCDRQGLTPACTQAVIAAGIAAVTVGALDPNPQMGGAGVARLRDAGIAVEVAHDPAALGLVEAFGVAIRRKRPYLHLKLAASLDGYVAPEAGPYWISGEATRAAVRRMRIAHDAVLVGAGTLVIDDPQLTVRPPHARRVPYRRVVVADRPTLPAERRAFARAPGYDPTLVLAAGPRGGYGQWGGLVEMVYVNETPPVDLVRALDALANRGIRSLLCEGGPRLAARLLAGGLVDRLSWIVAPRLLAGPTAVPALARTGGLADTSWSIDHVERFGDDVLLSARPASGACSPD
jgi:diaminohydroxyphosphoribosylaminopyrimidine deaminase/5-amino-6-(5-phosphoribosylamino)uracil reductase